MVALNQLLLAPPYPVDEAIRRLGNNLRTARLRRNMTIGEVAARIGTGRRAVADAEKGKASTAIAVYVALLWAYDLIVPLNELAGPASDEQGLMLISADERKRARKRRGLNSDF